VQKMQYKLFHLRLVRPNVLLYLPVFYTPL
jgi:hypothetical protein